MNKLPAVITRQMPDPILAAGFQLFKRENFKFLDFIRDSYTAQFNDKRGTFWAIVKRDPVKRGFTTLCSCNTFLQHMSCPHIAALFFLIYSKNPDSQELNETLSKNYDNSIWCNLAKLCYEHYGENKLNIFASLNSSETNPEIMLIAKDEKKQKIFEFMTPEPYLMRLVQTYRYKFFETISDEELPWKSFDESLEYLQPEKTELEIRMNETGFKSWRQKFEESYWFDLSKAWFFGFSDKSYLVEYLDKQQSLKIFSEDNQFNFFIPKPQVASILVKLAQNESIKKTLNLFDKKVACFIHN